MGFVFMWDTWKMAKDIWLKVNNRGSSECDKAEKNVNFNCYLISARKG